MKKKTKTNNKNHVKNEENIELVKIDGNSGANNESQISLVTVPKGIKKSWHNID